MSSIIMQICKKIKEVKREKMPQFQFTS